MNSKFIQSVLLVLCIGAVAVWQKTMAAEHLGSTFGVLSLLYLVFALRARKRERLTPVTAYLLLLSSLLLIAGTGSIESPLFFLIYFISFLLAFLLDPVVVYVFCFACCAFFLPEIFQGDRVAHLAKLSSIFLLAPLAYFFGHEMLRRRKAEMENAVIAEDIVEDVSEIVVNEGDHLSEEDVEVLKDIVDESRKLEKEV